MKIIIMLSTLIAMTFAGSPKRNEPKAVKKNGMTFQWQIEDETLRCIVTAPTTGWLAVGFNTSSDLQGTNLFMGAVEGGFYRIDDRYILSPGNHVAVTDLGAKDQIKYRHGEESQGETTIEFVIPMQAEDKYHLTLKSGNAYHLLMAYSLEDDFEHHSVMRTSTEIKL